MPDGLGWASITAYNGQIHVHRTGGAGWPTTNNAIVKFAYISPRTGVAMTHFCLVADQNAHTIVDSWDGVIRSPGYYGNPVAWAEYDNMTPQVVTPQPPPSEPATSTTGGGIYTFVKGDTVWAVAMRYGFTAQELMEHNNITDPRNLPIGYQLHLPVKKTPAPATIGVSYESLPEAKDMHVSKPGGAEKWGFANIKQWSDFKSVEHKAENTNVKIAGIATVLVGKETAAYYMEALDFGNCAATGVPTNTIGYNWKDLTEGAYTPPVVADVAVTTIALQSSTAVGNVDIPPPDPIEPIENPNAWKATYKAFDKPDLYIVQNTIMVKEMDGRQPDHRLIRNKAIVIAGTFIKDGLLFGRPKRPADLGYWFGIPMDLLVSDTDVHNSKIDVNTKKAMHIPLNKE